LAARSIGVESSAPSNFHRNSDRRSLWDGGFLRDGFLGGQFPVTPVGVLAETIDWVGTKRWTYLSNN
jgi:hypothetical protein